MTRDEITTFLTRRQPSWERRDVDALARDHADDCVLDSPMAGTVTGRPATTASGTDKGGFMGHAPLGRHFTFPLVLIYRLNDGRVVRQQALYDFTGVLRQIGVLKAKPR
jgi:hypothetical protein